MIQSVCAVAEADIWTLLRGESMRNTPIPPGFDWHLISIRAQNPGHLLTAKDLAILSGMHRLQSWLSMLFGDVCSPEEAASWDVSCFTSEQAKQVIQYLDAINVLAGDEILVVQCYAGKSRSAAIADFATRYYGLDYAAYRQKHGEYTTPNPLVLKLLNEAWAEHKAANEGKLAALPADPAAMDEARDALRAGLCNVMPPWLAEKCVPR